ncbi:MAG: penicillin-binding transpeptidase domain-containing protein [Pyrinomonadaceae bacterium]
MQIRLTAHSRGATARPDPSRQRALYISVFLAAWMLVIGGRLIYLQAFQHDWLSERARLQQQVEAQTSPERGLIVDREGRELARSAAADSIFVDPRELKDLNNAVSQLAPILKIQASEIASVLSSAEHRNRRFVWLARKVTPAQASRIAELEIPGVHSVKEQKRVYPHGALAAHVLGFVGTDEVGLGGVEHIYNSSLIGEGGKITVETDGRGAAYQSIEMQSRAGRTVQLTIDQAIQYHAEQVMADVLARTKARAATAVVLDPRSGEILALVNAPAFDPNNAGKVTPQMRTNEALQNIYEPGSTFKIVVYSAVIEEGLAKAEDRIDCQMGSITVAGRVVHDHHPYGSLTLTEALAKSSNVAAIKMGLRVGNERMYDYIKRFGFGSRTGVELPGETAGLLRPVGRWHPSSIGSIAIGQEIGVTPVQIASAFATLANDGVRVSPHLIGSVKKADGFVEFQAHPERQRVD